MGKLSKEVKIGLSVIGSLVVVLGLVGYKRLTRPAATPNSMAGDSTPEAAPAADRPKLAGFMGKPTVVPTEAESAQPHRASAWQTSDTPRRPVEQSDAPRASFLPTGANLAQAQGEEAVEDSKFQVTQAIEPAGSEDPFRQKPAQPTGSKSDVAGFPVKSSQQPASQAVSEEPAEIRTDAEPADTEPAALHSSSEPAAEIAFNPGQRTAATLPATTPATGEASPPSSGAFQSNSDSASAADGVQPVVVENGKYTVQPNDNYWTVSEKVYGSGGYFKAIHAHNKGRFPKADKLQVGDALDVPPATVLEQNYPELCPKQRKRPAGKSPMLQASARGPVGGQVYVVEEGDTLFDIARHELGKASRWSEIYAMNRAALGDDFDYLQPGTELLLPQQPSGDTLTRQKSSTLQR